MPSQVSAISKINSASPTTRVVAAFIFAKAGIRGQIADPEGNAAYDLFYDEAMAVRKYYAAFRNGRTLARMREIGDFTCIDLGDGLIWGVDKKIPRLLQFTVDDDVEGDFAVLNHLQHSQETYSALNGERLSVGPDGMVVGPADELQRRQQTD